MEDAREGLRSNIFLWTLFGKSMKNATTLTISTKVFGLCTTTKERKSAVWFSEPLCIRLLLNGTHKSCFPCHRGVVSHRSDYDQVACFGLCRSQAQAGVVLYTCRSWSTHGVCFVRQTRSFQSFLSQSKQDGHATQKKNSVYPNNKAKVFWYFPPPNLNRCKNSAHIGDDTIKIRTRKNQAQTQTLKKPHGVNDFCSKSAADLTQHARSTSR